MWVKRVCKKGVDFSSKRQDISLDDLIFIYIYIYIYACSQALAHTFKIILINKTFLLFYFFTLIY